MENFYLEPDEELFSIIDRIKRSRDESITLIAPSGLSALRSIINLRILKEEAISLGKDVSLVTADTLIKKLAQQSNIVVLEKQLTKIKRDEEEDLYAKAQRTNEESWPEQLREGGEIRPRPPLESVKPKRKVVSDIIRPKELPQLVEVEEEVREEFEEPPVAEAIEGKPTLVEPVVPEEPTPRPSFRIFTKRRLITLLVIIGLIGAGFVFYFVLPRVQITINPKKETIRSEIEIITDKNINSVILTDNAIPAQVFQLEMEDSRKFPTTGEKEIEERAKGTIIVYNQYSSSEQALVKTTRFLSEGGKLFRLAETTVIPGASIEEGKIIPSSKEVEVVADEPGESYNIGPSNFTIPGFEGTPKYTSFYGKSTEPMTGGAKGKMKVATKEDVEGAIEIVSLELKDKVREEFSKKIPQELKLLEDSQILEVAESNSSLQPGEPGKEFLVTVKAKAWGLAFKEDDVFYLIEKNIGEKISENKILLPSTIRVDYKDVELDLANGKANFFCRIEADSAWKIDEEKVKTDLAGKDEVEVRKYLSSLTEIESAKVIFWPFWVKRIPNDKDKIKIIIDTNI